MGKLVFLALLAGGGWWAWQHDLVPMPAALAAPSPAFEAYERFSIYLAHDQYGNARRVATRGAVRAVQIRELRGRRNLKLGISGRAISKDDKEYAHQGEVIGVSHELVAESTSQDGNTVTIQALERVCRRHGGCVEMQQDVDVCLVEKDEKAEWKVCSFRESQPPAGEIAAR